MKNKLPYEITSKAIQGYSDSIIAKSEKADCVVRAFASAFDIPYDNAHKYVAEQFGRKPKKGTYGTVSKLVRMADNKTTVNNKKVYPVGVRKSSTLINSLSYNVTIKGETKLRQMTVGTFIKQNPKGTFFVLVRQHAFTIKDGVVIGNFDDAVKTKKIMRCAFEIK
mgnify:CR=1 FL=1